MTKHRKVFTPRIRWTIEEVRNLIGIWDRLTVKEMSEELNRPVHSILAKAKQIREEGYPLSMKRVRKEKNYVIKEVLRELNMRKLHRK